MKTLDEAIEDAAWKFTGEIGLANQGKAFLASLAADGLVLVPREATLDMSIAFAEAFYRERRCIDDHDISEWWSAMLDAAPKPGDAP